MTARKLVAMIGTVLMLLSIVGPGVAAGASTGNQEAGNLTVDVAQDGDDVTVSVTYNGSAAAGANVSVSSNDSYVGTGDHVADADGEVGLPAPENDTTVTVTASYEGETASTTADLAAVDDGDGNATDAFGIQVSSFVHGLLENDTDDNTTVGQQVSAFVTANNPGADERPDHAGPPEDKTEGPPEDKGNDGDGGKPDNAGNDGEKGNNGNGGNGGPPDHAQNGNDDGDDEDDSDAEE